MTCELKHGERRPCKRCGGPKGPGAGRGFCDPCGQYGAVDATNRARERNYLNYHANPITLNRARTVRRYGLSITDYNDMLEKQSGRCAICGTYPTGRTKHLSVDHSHPTGKVRGLLCHRCNALVDMMERYREKINAYLEDSPTLLSEDEAHEFSEVTK